MQESILTMSAPFDHTTIRYWTGGAGRELLLLQGGMADAELHWRSVWDELEKSYRVIAPDLPGFGQSSPLPHPNWQVLSEWLKAFCDQLKLAKPIWVGNSFGGTCARAFAHLYPQRVAQLILVNGGGFIRLPKIARWLLGTPVGAYYIHKREQTGISQETLARMMTNQALLSEEFCNRCQQNSGTIFAIGRACILGPQPVGPLVMPTTIIWGKLDRHSPLTRAHALRQELTGAKLKVIDDAGHLPQLDNPGAFISVLQESIEKN